jgi:hypothetical protein
LARAYADAFAAQPKLADNLDVQHRYDAACYAALAASGQSTDTENLNYTEHSCWRRQALEWLRADLAAYERTQIFPKKTLIARLQHWKKDPDLVSIRDNDALAKLPDEERAQCQKLWADVEDLLKKTQEQMKAEDAARQKKVG